MQAKILAIGSAGEDIMADILTEPGRAPALTGVLIFVRAPVSIQEIIARRDYHDPLAEVAASYGGKGAPVLPPTILQDEPLFKIVNLAVAHQSPSRIPVPSLHLEIVALLEAHQAIGAGPVAMKPDPTRSIWSMVRDERSGKMMQRGLIQAVFSQSYSDSQASTSYRAGCMIEDLKKGSMMLLGI